jgi:ZIP family zinc transporter
LRWDLFIALFIIPWIATYAGSVSAVFIKTKDNRSQGALLGFAAGVMIAASIWSLVVTIGFLLGCLGMLGLDKIVPHKHNEQELTEGVPSHLSRPMLLVLAVALHNIPEGLALGVVAASAMGNSGVSISSALMFGLGLGLQNYPEGLAVVMPLYQSGYSKKRCIRLGFIASLVEPAAALVGLAFTSILTSMGGFILPMMLSIAAGAMIFIVVEELIPESQAVESQHFATYGFLLGFWVMALMGIMGA